jgi:hypothetical protein
MVKYLAVLLPIFFFICGCEKGSGVCYALDKCAASMPNCELYFEALILPEGCEEAIIDADCADHYQEPPPYTDLCFPPCEADSAVCDGDTITACYDGKTTVTRCAENCKLYGGTYVGVCSNEYEGQQSSDGQDICWCE